MTSGVCLMTNKYSQARASTPRTIRDVGFIAIVMAVIVTMTTR